MTTRSETAAAATRADLWLFADTGETEDGALLAACEALLDEQERDRLESFGASRRRREFVLGHALARIALQHLCPSVTAAAWRLGRDTGGRPQARAADGSTPALSIAHTHGLLLAAVAPAGELGVDVEWCGRRPATLAVAERFFAASEVASIRAAGAAARVERFLAYWTMKEAYLKARGVGLRLPLRDIVFDLPAGAAPSWRAGENNRAPDHAIEVAFASSMDDRPARWALRQWAHIGGHLVGFAHGAQHAPAAPRLHELDRVSLLATLRAPLTSR